MGVAAFTSLQLEAPQNSPGEELPEAAARKRGRPRGLNVWRIPLPEGAQLPRESPRMRPPPRLPAQLQDPSAEAAEPVKRGRGRPPKAKDQGQPLKRQKTESTPAKDVAKEMEDPHQV